MQSWKNKEDTIMSGTQNGTTAGLPQRNPERADKRTTVSKQVKSPKSSPKEQQHDMRFFAQKAPGSAKKAVEKGLVCHPRSPGAKLEGAELSQDAIMAQKNMLPADTEVGGEGSEQPTIADILHAVNKCTASVDHLKEQFGGLKVAVVLVRQDLQKVIEIITAAEGRISDIEEQLPPLVRESQITARLAKVTDLRAEDIENRLRWTNVRTLDLPEKVEGRDPTKFVERRLLDIF